MDVKLTGDGTDVDMSSGGLELLRGGQAIGQHAVTRLRTWQTESPYDRAAGLPYIGGILGGEVPVEAAEFFFEREIVTTPGIVGIITPVDVEVDGTTRALRGTATARSLDDEPIAIDTSVSVEI